MDHRFVEIIIEYECSPITHRDRNINNVCFVTLVSVVPHLNSSRASWIVTLTCVRIHVHVSMFDSDFPRAPQFVTMPKNCMPARVVKNVLADFYLQISGSECLLSTPDVSTSLAFQTGDSNNPNVFSNSFLAR